MKSRDRRQPHEDDARRRTRPADRETQEREREAGGRQVQVVGAIEQRRVELGVAELVERAPVRHAHDRSHGHRHFRRIAAGRMKDRLAESRAVKDAYPRANTRAPCPRRARRSPRSRSGSGARGNARLSPRATSACRSVSHPREPGDRGEDEDRGNLDHAREGGAGDDQARPRGDRASARNGPGPTSPATEKNTIGVSEMKARPKNTNEGEMASRNAARTARGHAEEPEFPAHRWPPTVPSEKRIAQDPAYELANAERHGTACPASHCSSGNSMLT